MAKTSGRPYIYLQSTHTRATGRSKEDIARQIADDDGITEGLVCVLAAVEPCMSIQLKKNSRGRYDVVRRKRKCLHFYYYLIDCEFGWMYVRLQSWFPMQVQIYINGREWLCRQLDAAGVGYRRYANCLPEIDDLAAAQDLCERFFRRKWPRLLNRFAARVNPWLRQVEQSGFRGYYWVTEQCEVATDVMFNDVKTLRALMPDLLEHATLNLSGHDVLRFVGGKRLCSEVTTDHKHRREGRRVKHRHKRNTIKMYDKDSVLRIETTVNNPREFKVLRCPQDEQGKRSRRWMPMRKGVADFWRLGQVGGRANERYLEALAQAQPKGKAVEHLDRLCHSRTKQGRRYARFNPVAAEDSTLFEAVLAGQHAINGFRNKDLAALLYNAPPSSPVQARRRCARVSRLIRKLRGHGLVAKVPRSRLYRPTKHGVRVMSAVLNFRNRVFPQDIAAASE